VCAYKKINYPVEALLTPMDDIYFNFPIWSDEEKAKEMFAMFDWFTQKQNMTIAQLGLDKDARPIKGYIGKYHINLDVIVPIMKVHSSLVNHFIFNFFKRLADRMDPKCTVNTSPISPCGNTPPFWMTKGFLGKHPSQASSFWSLKLKNNLLFFFIRACPCKFQPIVTETCFSYFESCLLHS
jgi:hypothetical protein